MCLKTLLTLIPECMTRVYNITVGSPAHVFQLTELQKEALNLSSRRPHENVVAFRGVVTDEHDAIQYIVMELLNGGSLKAYLEGVLKERGALEPRRLLSWMVDSACGLAFLHTSGPRAVVHRDLKPDNLLVRVCGDGSAVIVVGDLGESKALAASNAFTLVGNAFTKAPEVLDGRGYGPHSDVYSWALTMFIVALQGLASPGDGSLVADPFARYPTPAQRKDLKGDALARVRGLGDDVAALLERCSAETHTERPRMVEVLQELLVAADRQVEALAVQATAADWLVRLQ